MWEVIGGLFLWTLFAGVIPVMSAELMVVVAAVAVAPSQVPLVAAVATLGQMIAKAALYFTARWAPSRLPARALGAIDRGAIAIEKRGGAAGSLIFVSAAVGLPPFYAISLAAGALRVRSDLFLIIGTAGRAVRFGMLAWAATRFGEGALEFFR